MHAVIVTCLIILKWCATNLSPCPLTEAQQKISACIPNIVAFWHGFACDLIARPLSELSSPTRFRETILSCRFFPNLPGRSYHNPHHRPLNLIPMCYQGVEKVMLLCGGISRLSRILVEVGTSTGVWIEVSVGAAFCWLSLRGVWIVIVLSNSQLLSKSTYPGFIYAAFICVWAEVGLVRPGAYIWCIDDGLVMLFACGLDQLPAEKISIAGHQNMLFWNLSPGGDAGVSTVVSFTCIYKLLKVMCSTKIKLIYHFFIWTQLV